MFQFPEALPNHLSQLLEFQDSVLIPCHKCILMIVQGSVHLTAADGPGDRFIIGESQAGEQVRFIGLKRP